MTEPSQDPPFDLDSLVRSCLPEVSAPGAGGAGDAVSPWSRIHFERELLKAVMARRRLRGRELREARALCEFYARLFAAGETP